MREKRKFNGIRGRWMLISIGVVMAVLLVSVATFSLAMTNYYYATISEGLQARATAATKFFSNYKTEREYLAAARNYVDTFEESARMELQFLWENGSVLYSSNGLTLAGSSPGTGDVTKAMETKEPETWSGKREATGERIMAVSAPLLYNGQTVGLLRYVTSLRNVDRQLGALIAAAMCVAVAILALVYFANSIFVRSIVVPVAAITETAKRIAGGSYGIQMEKQHDDEIGDLTDAINDMSMKIQQSERIKSEFISSVSHELRTPLTAISGWAETIQGGEVSDQADVQKGMGIIVSEAHRLTNMVEELLEFSRIEDGRFTLLMESIDIKAELEDAVYTYREFFRREGIQLNYSDCEEEFPAMEGDPERLRQVFCNLLDNAAKHGGAGKRIDAAIRAEEGEAVITIRDYGPGIPLEELPNVKLKFYKGSSKARGSGIGLAVCDEIVTRHNGTLELSNAEGGGCLVTIRLKTGT